MGLKRRQEEDVRQALGGDALENECGIECALLLTPGFTSDKDQKEGETTEKAGELQKRICFQHKKSCPTTSLWISLEFAINKWHTVTWGHGWQVVMKAHNVIFNVMRVLREHRQEFNFQLHHLGAVNLCVGCVHIYVPKVPFPVTTHAPYTAVNTRPFRICYRFLLLMNNLVWGEIFSQVYDLTYPW